MSSKKPENMSDEELFTLVGTLKLEQKRREDVAAASRARQQYEMIQALVTCCPDKEEGGLSPLDILVPDHTPPRYGDDLCTDRDLNGVYRRHDDPKEYPCTRCRGLYAAQYSVEQMAERPFSITLEIEL